jgi:hypothetical protein
LTSTAFTPQDINLRGNFGRGFKILLGGKEILNGTAFSVSTKNGVFGSNAFNAGVSTIQPQFSSLVKTGYGATKLLQSIIQKSDGSDSKGPFKLYFYNFALGESYLVVAPSKALTLSQDDQNSNMIWNYDLSLTIIAPLESVTAAKQLSSLSKLLVLNVVQNSVNQVGKDVAGYLSSF